MTYGLFEKVETMGFPFFFEAVDLVCITVGFKKKKTKVGKRFEQIYVFIDGESSLFTNSQHLKTEDVDVDKQGLKCKERKSSIYPSSLPWATTASFPYSLTQYENVILKFWNDRTIQAANEEFQLGGSSLRRCIMIQFDHIKSNKPKN